MKNISEPRCYRCCSHGSAVAGQCLRRSSFDNNGDDDVMSIASESANKKK